MSNRWVDREKKWLDAKDVIYFHFTFIIFNVQLNQTTISENVFDTIQFFMRRKF